MSKKYENVDVAYTPTKTDKFLESLFTREDENINYLKGRILTIVDASTEDSKRREALKDLIHQVFQDYSNNRHYPLNSEISNNLKQAMGEKPWEDSFGNSTPNSLPSLK